MTGQSLTKFAVAGVLAGVLVLAASQSADACHRCRAQYYTYSSYSYAMPYHGFGYSYSLYPSAYAYTSLKACCPTYTAYDPCCRPAPTCFKPFYYRPRLCCPKPYCRPICPPVCCDPCYDPCCGSTVIGSSKSPVQSYKPSEPVESAPPEEPVELDEGLQPVEGADVGEPDQPTDESILKPAEEAPADEKDAVPGINLQPSGATPTVAAPDSATLTVNVPADARVFINDRPTSTRGTSRQYISRGLEPHARYTYQVKAVVYRHGQPLTQTRFVAVSAGEEASVDFGFGASQFESVAGRPTTLRLHVPTDAAVTLAGSPTKATGAVRIFTTNVLASGQTWDDYKIEVSVERDGQIVKQEKTLSLVAGQSRTVRFDFDAASRIAAIDR
jgi:uncharacterized protein (TIGR03000 family)